MTFKRERERETARCAKWKHKNKIFGSVLLVFVLQRANLWVIKCHIVAKANIVAGILIHCESKTVYGRIELKGKISHTVDIKPLKCWRSLECSKLPNIKKTRNEKRNKRTDNNNNKTHIYSGIYIHIRHVYIQKTAWKRQIKIIYVIAFILSFKDIEYIFFLSLYISRSYIWMWMDKIGVELL